MRHGEKTESMMRRMRPHLILSASNAEKQQTTSKTDHSAGKCKPNFFQIIESCRNKIDTNNQNINKEPNYLSTLKAVESLYVTLSTSRKSRK